MNHCNSIDTTENSRKSIFLVGPELLLFAYIIWIFFRNGIVDHGKNTFYLPSAISKVAFLIEPSFLLLFGFISILTFRLYKKTLPFFIMIVLLLFVFFESIFANDLPLPQNAVFFFFGYFQFMFLSFYVFSFFSFNSLILKKYLNIFLSLMSIQLLFNLGWLLKVNPFKNERRFMKDNLDWAYGTLASTNEIAGISIVPLLLGLYAVLFMKDKVLRKNNVLYKYRWYLIVGSLFLMLLADSKLTYGSLVVGGSLISFNLFKGSILKKILIPICVFMFFTGFLYLVAAYYEYKFHIYGSSNIYFSRLVTGVIRGVTNENPKFKVAKRIHDELGDDVLYPLIGGGPGNISSRFAIKNPTPLSRKYIVNDVDYVFNVLKNTALLLPNTAFNSIFGDLGILGVIFYFGIHLYLMFTVSTFYRLGLYIYWWEAPLAFAFSIFTSYYLVHSLIFDQNYMGVQGAFIWIVGPILYSIGKQRKCVDKINEKNKP